MQAIFVLVVANFAFPLEGGVCASGGGGGFSLGGVAVGISLCLAGIGECGRAEVAVVVVITRLCFAVLADQIAVRLRSVNVLRLGGQVVFLEDVVVVPQIFGRLGVGLLFDQKRVFLIGGIVQIRHQRIVGELNRPHTILGVPKVRGDVAGRRFDRLLISHCVVGVGRGPRIILSRQQRICSIVD